MALVAKAHRVRERFEVLQNAQQEAAVLRTAHRLLRGRVDTLEAQLVAAHICTHLHLTQLALACCILCLQVSLVPHMRVPSAAHSASLLAASGRGC